MTVTLDTIELLQPSSTHRRQKGGEGTALLPHFIAGPENAFALFVCRQQESISLRGNPLLLVGPTGCGKTTLAMTIATLELEQHNGDASMLYLPAADFARNYTNALSADDLEHFRERTDSIDLLVIDDVHSIAEKPSSQEELAARLESRDRRGMPSILTCRRLPSEFRGIRPLLASRMLPGLTVSLRLPGQEARQAIIEQLCQKNSLKIDPDWIDLLCRGLPDSLSVRRLAAVVNHLRLLDENKKPIDAVAIQAAITVASGGNEPTIGAIAKAVARRFQLKTAELKSSTRRQQVVRARALAMYLGRQLTASSLQQIGEYFGGRDHSTVLHACRKTSELLASNSQLSQTADEVREQLQTA